MLGEQCNFGLGLSHKELNKHSLCYFPILECTGGIDKLVKCQSLHRFHDLSRVGYYNRKTKAIITIHLPNY